MNGLIVILAPTLSERHIGRWEKSHFGVGPPLGN